MERPERPALYDCIFRLACSPKRAFPIEDDKGVYSGFVALNARKHRLEDFDRRDLPRANERRQVLG